MSRITIDEKALNALHEGIADRARKIEELEAEVKRLNEARGNETASKAMIGCACPCGKTPIVRALERGKPYPHQAQCEECWRRGPICADSYQAYLAWRKDYGRIEELEARVGHLNALIGGSVLPLESDDGTRIFASAISGGADYVDGMPRQVRLVVRDAKGNETERQYLQTDERRRE